MRQKAKVSIDIYDLRGEGIHVFASAFVSGIPIRMLIDTGASKTIFDLHFIHERLNHVVVEKTDETVQGFTQGHNELFSATLPDVYFNTSCLQSPLVRVLELSHVNSIYDQLSMPPVQGIMGSDWLHMCRAIIDYSTGKLKLKIPFKETPIENDMLLSITMPDTETEA